jgi:hypothetical protein
MKIILFAKCLGMGNKTMNYNKQVNSFAGNLVFHYATYNNFSGCYELDLSDIEDFDLHEFAQVIMSSDNMLAAEATSPDNISYEKIMLPALLAHLKDTTDRDNEIEFIKIWREGVTSYFSNIMQELINEHCNNRIHSEHNEEGFYAHKRPDNGETYWSRY